MDIHVKGSVIADNRDFFFKKMDFFRGSIEREFKLTEYVSYDKPEIPRIIPKDVLEVHYKIQLELLDRKTIQELLKFFLKFDDLKSKNIVSKIKIWLNNLANPLDAKLTNLKSFDKIIKFTNFKNKMESDNKS